MTNKKNKLKKFWKKFWYIVWKDDSFKGWIISLVFIFILIKLIFFPLLNLVTGTTMPLAIVETCSMHHQGTIFSNFDNWWERHENKYQDIQITKENFKEFKLKNGFTKGDILFIVKAKPKKLEKGDIIIFNANRENPIIHRIINITQENETYYFSTLGDNNNGQLKIEKKISEDRIIGKAYFRLVPYIGWMKLVFYEPFRPKYEKGICHENEAKVFK